MSCSYFTPRTSQEMGESCGSLRRSPPSLPPLQSCLENAESQLKEKAEHHNSFHRQDFTECAWFFVCLEVFVVFFPSEIKAESIYTSLPSFSQIF